MNIPGWVLDTALIAIVFAFIVLVICIFHSLSDDFYE